jgi:predicted dienelactone hydrolase
MRHSREREGFRHNSVVDLWSIASTGQGAVLLKTCFTCIAMLCCLAFPATAAGIQLLESNGLAGAIWYPCAAAPKSVPLGSLALPFSDTLQGVKDCPVTGGKLSLVVISRGRSGWFAGHHDTAEALADAGFVVAAINHPGNNGGDLSQSEALSIFASRPADIVRLLDFMLKDWKDRAAIDPERIALFTAILTLASYDSFASSRERR